ncbi:unnamed protein product [Alopecurus aequalis]
MAPVSASGWRLSSWTSWISACGAGPVTDKYEYATATGLGGGEATGSRTSAGLEAAGGELGPPPWHTVEQGVGGRTARSPPRTKNSVVTEGGAGEVEVAVGS